MKTVTPYDPAYLLHSITRSTLILGSVCTVFGMWMMVVFGYFNRFPHFGIYFKLLGVGVWVLPGAAFLVAGIFLARRARWAVILTIIVAIVQFLMAVGILVASLTLPPFSIVPSLLALLWSCALAQMAWQGWRVLGAIASLQSTGNGFEAMPAAPVHVLPLHDSSE